MIAFSLPEHRQLLPAELGESTEPAVGRWRAGRFPDGELWCELDSAIAGKECAVLGSLAPPDEQTLAVLMLAQTLRRAGAARVAGPAHTREAGDVVASRDPIPTVA